MNRIDQLFSNMDRWRHLPAYQLERRADIFFSLYLAEVLEGFTGVPMNPRLVPELPIKRDLIWPDKPSNQSLKVDYAVFAADRSKLFLVELKTDSGSRRDQQDFYLDQAAKIGLPKILDGIVEIVQATKAHQKYGHLLQILAEHGCLALPPDLLDFTFPKARPGLRKRQQQIEVTVKPAEFEIEVVYVQPTKGCGDESVIDFERFAEVVESHGDQVSQVFASHLRRWVEQAGSQSVQ
jgi:hypothetical protein